MGLVLPTGNGKVESHSNIVQRGFHPILLAAGLTGKYGLHTLRHACASLWIENGINAKRVQTLMGHSTIQMTFDVYGHLFTDGDADQRAAEDIQIRLLGQ
jgi:integrase